MKTFLNDLVATSITTIRRQNAVSLFQRFVEERIAAGDQPKGLEAAFAERLGVGGATWSMAKSGARPIGDKLARQIEQKTALESGWLDIEREPAGMTPGEQQFMAMALKAYRGTNSAGRKELKQLMKAWAEKSA